MVIESEVGRRLDRTMYILSGLRQRNVTVHNTTLAEAIKTVKERFLFVSTDQGWVRPHEPDEGLIFDTFKEFRRKLVAKIGHVEGWDTTEFVSSYTGKKRTMYARWAERFIQGEFSEERHSIVKGFIKIEKKDMPVKHYGMQTTYQKDSAARGISPRHPLFNIAIGRYIKKMEKKIYKSLQSIFRETTPVVSKGYNNVEQAQHLLQKHNKYTDPVWLLFDAERFDEHVSKPMLKWLTSIYNECINDIEFAKWVKRFTNNRIVFQCDNGRIKFKLKRNRMSGEMDTGLGNTIVSLAILYSFLKKHNLLTKVSPYDNGDDLIVGMDRSTLHYFDGYKQHAYELGFRMKVDGPYNTFEEIVFCQTQPVWDGKQYRMVRQFPLAIDKDCCTVLPITTPKAMDHWFYDIYQCGQVLTDGIPVYSAFYSMFKRWNFVKKGFNLDISVNFGEMERQRGLVYTGAEITPEARYSFWLAFGVTPDEQRALEHTYDTMQRPLFCNELTTVDEEVGYVELLNYYY